MTDKQMIAVLTVIKKIAIKCDDKDEIMQEIEDIIIEAKNTSKGTD